MRHFLNSCGWLTYIPNNYHGILRTSKLITDLQHREVRSFKHQLSLYVFLSFKWLKKKSSNYLFTLVLHPGYREGWINEISLLAGNKSSVICARNVRCLCCFLNTQNQTMRWTFSSIDFMNFLGTHFLHFITFWSNYETCIYMHRNTILLVTLRLLLQSLWLCLIVNIFIVIKLK